ncbi:FadR/GntR family transcriptional regulator [Buchananella hordeovulneris]|uniref:FadR/GntR family transcriptional regulator n=1 Tax=Buchananella hordeovulneris TaxID=52770 RepID=UPI001FED629D|nr:GntR family transcriptional regulator [Buchananella hordeovulneris]
MPPDEERVALMPPLPRPSQTGTLPLAASRSQATMEAIESYILARKLKPGDPLPTEATLCNDLGVSRSSVREALRQLQALEIVSVQQGRGAFVGDMSLRPLVRALLLRSSIAPDSFEALTEVVTVRRVLDLGLATEIVGAMAGTRNNDLHELVDRMVNKAEQGQRFMDEDIAFHQGLLAKVDNLLLAQLASAMWLIHMTALPSLPGEHAELTGLVDTARAHRSMLVAAESGDLAGYQNAVEAHYAPLLTAISQVR